MICSAHLSTGLLNKDTYFSVFLQHLGVAGNLLKHLLINLQLWQKPTETKLIKDTDRKEFPALSSLYLRQKTFPLSPPQSLKDIIFIRRPW